MKKIMIIFLAAVCLVCGLSWAGVGDNAPEFSLKDIKGKEVVISDFKGNENVLLFFWTTWCPHCRSNIIKISREKEALASHSLRVITVNVNESAAKVESFLTKNSLDVPVLLDSDATVAGLYAVLGVPTFILINKEGRIVFDDHYFPDDFKDMVSR